MENSTEWTYEGYWNVVLGDRDADTVVREFDLAGKSSSLPEEQDMSMWLSEAESAAAAVGNLEELPGEWSEFHDIALKELLEAAEEVRSEQG